MYAVILSTVLAFAAVILLTVLFAFISAGLFVLVVARKGGRPVELSPRAAAGCVIMLSALVGWNALAMLDGLL